MAVFLENKNFASARRLIIDFEGQRFGSDEELKARFIKELNFSSSYLNHPSIKSLIEKGYIVPLRIQPTLMTKLSTKLFKPKPDPEPLGKALGYYEPVSHKIYLFVESDADRLFVKGTAEPLILHELQHLVARISVRSFLKIHEVTLTKFYSEFFKQYFGYDDKFAQEDIKKAYSILFKLEIEKIRTVNEYMTALKKVFSKYKINNFDVQIASLGYAISLWFKGWDVYEANVRRPDSISRHIYFAIKESYNKSLNIQSNMFYAQEIMIPSEVIAVEAQTKPKNRHFVLVKRIK